MCSGGGADARLLLPWVSSACAVLPLVEQQQLAVESLAVAKTAQDPRGPLALAAHLVVTLSSTRPGPSDELPDVLDPWVLLAVRSADACMAAFPSSLSRLLSRQEWRPYCSVLVSRLVDIASLEDKLTRAERDAVAQALRLLPSETLRHPAGSTALFPSGI